MYIIIIWYFYINIILYLYLNKHLDPCHWAEIEDVFLRDACALMGLAIESPLGKVQGHAMYRICKDGLCYEQLLLKY